MFEKTWSVDQNHFFRSKNPLSTSSRSHATKKDSSLDTIHHFAISLEIYLLICKPFFSRLDFEFPTCIALWLVSSVEILFLVQFCFQDFSWEYRVISAFISWRPLILCLNGRCFYCYGDHFGRQEVFYRDTLNDCSFPSKFKLNFIHSMHFYLFISIDFLKAAAYYW